MGHHFRPHWTGTLLRNVTYCTDTNGSRCRMHLFLRYWRRITIEFNRRRRTESKRGSCDNFLGWRSGLYTQMRRKERHSLGRRAAQAEKLQADEAESEFSEAPEPVPVSDAVVGEHSE
jgi:hypothetical protein